MWSVLLVRPAGTQHPARVGRGEVNFWTVSGQFGDSDGSLKSVKSVRQRRDKRGVSGCGGVQ